MFRFMFRRLGPVLAALLGVSLLSFALVHLVPGDPVTVLTGQHGLTPAEHARLLHELGLDRPWWDQYLRYVGAAAHGDLGVSLFTQEPVRVEFMQRLGATLELSAGAMLVAVLLGVPAGVFAALHRGRGVDHLVMSVSLGGYSMPVFWWGLLLILLFSVHLGWTPVSGRLAPQYWIEPRTGLMLVDTLLAGNLAAFRDALRHLLLPALTLGTMGMAVIARMTRSAMLEVLGQDYVRTARAKGLSEPRVVVVHALRNALIPVITALGLQAGSLLGGAVLTETVFSWPGIGQWMVQAIQQRDYPVVQGGMLLIACLVIGINTLVDLGYGLLDPRIRHAR
ncbi:MAG: ABC transporter permease subunit [Betaproteobacteria bacterium]|nr:ABC transporter permease subunit [Betaproteobacteria bacterium]